MRFNSALFTTFLFASAVSAIRRRGSQFLDLVEKVTKATSDGVEYTTDWAGAIRRKDTAKFTHVSGIITVPNMSAVTIDSAATAWVGIDGDTCKTALLQSGVLFGHAQNGPYYWAMYWSYPDIPVVFENITVSAGDIVKLTVGTFTFQDPIALRFVSVENLSNNESAIKYLNFTQGFCGQNAEWVVESYAQYGTPYADFGTMTFRNASALTSDGHTFGPLGAEILEIEQNRQVVGSASVNDGSVTIKHP